MFGLGKKKAAPQEEEWLDPEEAAEQKRKKRRKRLMIILFVLAAVLGTAAGVFYTFWEKGQTELEETVSTEEAEETLPPPANFVPAHYVEAYFMVENEKLPAPVQDEDMIMSEWIEAEKLSEYIYSGVKKPGEAAEAYSAILTGETEKFMIVDEMLNETAPPDFTAAEGMVLMGRVRPDAKITTIRVNWAPDTLEVEVAAGRVKPIEVGPSLSHIEILDTLQNIHPSELELSGDSMAEYETYVMNGIVFVGNEPCVSVKVYSTQNEEQTNNYENIYFLSRDGKRIYRLNPETDTVSQLR